MKKFVIIIFLLLIGLLIAGFGIYRAVSSQFKVTQSVEDDSSEIVNENLPENKKVLVEVSKDANKKDSIIMKISKLDKAYSSLAYEITYETQGIYQGVNSGSKPIDINGKDEIERDVYLGTCSKNVCKPHTGVSTVSVALEFTEKNGKKSKFSNDFSL